MNGSAFAFAIGAVLVWSVGGVATWMLGLTTPLGSAVWVLAVGLGEYVAFSAGQGYGEGP